ncbi:enoyl-CoA hydratase/isomerase family protein [Sphingomonas sp. MMS24-JH45]
MPGDGVHLVWPALLGPNRGRYFLLTGETIDAVEAQRLGVVAEVLPPDRLMARAREIAARLARQSDLVLRHTRTLLTAQLRRSMLDHLGYGLALEGLAAIHHWPPGERD